MKKLTLEDLLKKDPVYLEIFDSKESVKREFIKNYSYFYADNNQEITDTESVMWRFRNQEDYSNKKQKVDEQIKEINEINILFAYYEYQNYSGDAFILEEVRR